MRVIAGRARGMRLRAPRGADVRPTADRVKESLFSMLADRIQGASVLDLFAGSGALGIEAVSRGAQRAGFVDRARASLEAVRDNVGRAGLADQAELVRGDALAAIRSLAEAGRTFDLVFADPPYEAGMAARVVAVVGRHGIVRPGGCLVVEHSVREEIPAVIENLRAVRTRVYGDTVVTIFERSDTTTPDSGDDTGKGEGWGEDRALPRQL